MDTANALLDDDPNSPKNIARRRALGIVERDAGGRLLPGSKLPGAGRPDGTAITTLARQSTQLALNVLIEVAADPKAPQAARVTASQALLDRGWGKAAQQIDIAVRPMFDSFLRDVGLAVTYEHEQAALAAAVETVIDEGDDERGRTIKKSHDADLNDS